MAIAELDSSLVTVGQPVDGGAAWVSFADSQTLPTDATTAMSTFTDFESIGELSDDGIQEGADISSEDTKGWHGTTVLSVVDETTKTYQITCIEYDRGTVAKLRYGADNVELNDDGTWSAIHETPSLPDIVVPFVFDLLESNGNLVRKVIHKAKVTDVDDIEYKNGELIGIGITFTVLDPGTGSDVDTYRAKPATTTTTTTS